MEQAAMDNNVELTFVTTDRYSTITDELKALEKEQQNGANAIIFEPIAADGYETFLSENAGNCVLVLLNSDVSPENMYSKVEPDNNLMGSLLYEAVSKNHPYGFKNYKIGIITGHSSQMAIEERSKSLLIHENLNSQVAWTINVDGMTDKKLADTANANPVDIIIALGNYETEKAIDYVLSNGLAGGVEIYGSGYSEKAIYHMDLGTVTAMVLTNEFNEGYLSIEAACNQIKRGGTTKQKIEEVFIATRDNLYDDDLQKILFPVVQ